MNGITLPRRRVVLELKIGADTRERMIEELEEIAAAIRKGEMWGDCVMGSASAGYTVSATEDKTVTHDTYFAALNDLPK